MVKMSAAQIAHRKVVCREIADDMKADATAFDGKPFNGRTVAEYFGNQGAAIAALANIVAELLSHQEDRMEQDERKDETTTTTGEATTTAPAVEDTKPVAQGDGATEDPKDEKEGAPV